MRRGAPAGARSRIVLLLFLVPVSAAPLLGQSDERPRLEAGVLGSAHRVDGMLDEPEWASAPAGADLVMVEPRQGDRPNGRTVVKVLAGPKALVFGIRCEDPEPAGIVTFTKERDGDFDSEDHVVVVLDPFQDGRSGYVFAVNPGGARFDALVKPGGREIDSNWDGQWEAGTSRDASGWTAEIRIPVEILSFRRDLREWGLNVQRRVQRLQETDRWSGARQDYSVFQTSRAGLLEGLPSFDLGLGLSVRPSLVGGFNDPAPDAPAEGTAEPSLDLTQRLGSNALASLTVNTDFAEVEVDTRQTNLTRFPLFFPEKRSFFLDASDIFAFGAGIDSESLLPFFSRRIGLVEGQEVPILAGLKATGRAGGTSFGGLVVRTRDVEGLAPDATLGVLRLQQNVLSESRVGLIATAGDPLGRSGSFEIGADLTYQTSRFHRDKNFITGVWGLVTGRDDLAAYRERTAFGFKIDYPNDLWDCSFTYRRIGDGFDPSLGFVPRRGINSYDAGCTYAPRPSNGFVRQMFHELYPSLVTDLGGRWESYSVFMAPVNWRLESGDRFELNVVPTGERLTEPFEIVEGVRIPQGAHQWLRYRVELETAAKRRLSGQATWWFGGFYTGTLHQLELEAAWTPSPLVTFLVNGEHDIGRLKAGDFDLTLVGLKVRLNLSPDLQLNTFLQYDDADRSFGTNTRLRWTFHPRGDLFVVYNHNLREIEDRWRRDSNELLVKLQYTFRR
jgi:Domain of unknown function (DUF5916)